MTTNNTKNYRQQGGAVDNIGGTLNILQGGNLTHAVTTLAAAGNSQSTAAVITSDIVTVTGADATKGVILPPMLVGEVTWVINTSAAACPVYPQGTGTINALSASAAISVAAASSAEFIQVTSTNVRTIPTIPS